MLWGQNIKVCTDHANLMRDALDLTSDQVYQWRILWECVTAGCKAFSLANGKGMGANDWVIRSLDD
jgi:hypothetical protein